MEITAVTYNIHHGKGMDGKINLHRIAEMIHESGADLVGLNEVDRCFSRRSGFVDQVSWLADRLNMHSAFAEALTTKRKDQAQPGAYGNACLTRFPILSQQQYPLGEQVRSGIREARVLLEIAVQLPYQSIKLYVTHLSLNPLVHRKQIDFIVKQIMEDKEVTLLMGDMNMRPGFKSWKKITDVLDDSCQFQDAGTFLTFPSLRPKVQLDYIFTSKNVRNVKAEVIRTCALASDHLPLKATFRV